MINLCIVPGNEGSDSINNAHSWDVELLCHVQNSMYILCLTTLRNEANTAARSGESIKSDLSTVNGLNSIECVEMSHDLSSGTLLGVISGL